MSIVSISGEQMSFAMLEAPAPREASDESARTSALDIGRSWIVEAPAGSGKTGLLIQRYLKLLSSVDDPGEVLALTFTVKATAELRDRVLAALQAAANPAADEGDLSAHDLRTRDLALKVLQRDSERQWNIRERPHRLRIRTIDALCGEIAQASPSLADSAAFATPLTDATPLYRRAAHAVTMRFGGEDKALNEAIRTVLLRRDGDVAECERLLSDMLQTREQWGPLLPMGRADLSDEELDRDLLPALNATLEKMICSELSSIREDFPPALLEEVASIAADLGRASGYKGGPNDFTACAAAPGAPGSDAQHLNHWLLIAHLLLTRDNEWRKAVTGFHLGVDADKFTLQRLKDLVEDWRTHDAALALLCRIRELPPASYDADQWTLAKAVFRMLRQALIELKVIFAEEGACDFTERLLVSLAALRHSAHELPAAMGVELRHLLVDEMQDTSVSQYALLEELTAGWDGASQTVFLVGDPKQSIYMFRQARVEMFQESLRTGRLRDISLGVLRLSANFRSGRRIVSAFNDVFSRVFPSASAGDGEVPFGQSVAVLPEAENEGMEWHIGTVAKDPDDPTKNRATAGRQEAEAICRVITDVRRRPKAHRNAEESGASTTIAVLTRVKAHVAQIVAALAVKGIPARSVEMEELAERREVLDAHAITRALLHPADRVAWLALLRAPWCGAGVGDLHTLAAGDDRAHQREAPRLAMRQRAENLDMPIRERVLRTLDVMDGAVTRMRTDPVADVVARAWTSLGGDLCWNASEQDNVREYIALLDNIAESSSMDAAIIEERLKRLFAAPSHAENAVEVLTVHRAKGLEWDVVMIPGMHRRGAGDRYSLLRWHSSVATAGGDENVLLAAVGVRGFPADGLGPYLNGLRQKRSRAELKRLMYVAATRARHELHLFAFPDERSNGDVRIEPDSLLSTVWSTAEPVLRAGEAAADSFRERLRLSLLREEMGEGLAFAAAEDMAPATRRPKIARLRNGIDPLLSLRESTPLIQRKPAREPHGRHFHRPAGSLTARATGTVVHAFAERIAKEASAVSNPGGDINDAFDGIATSLSTWMAAIRTALRASGLNGSDLETSATTVERALRGLLTTADGRWLLQPHANASSESAWRAQDADNAIHVRLDRSFFAGTEPHADGEDVLWIVDFKTSERVVDQRVEFLAAERALYQSQLETYARVRLKDLPAKTPVRLALMFPLMGTLLWWPFEG